MKLAFCLFKYFPYGGLQRDFLRLAKLCLARGHTVDVYTMEWQSEQGSDDHSLNVHIIKMPKYYSNHKKAAKFNQALQNIFNNKKYDLVIGFNKIAGLDIYYAADSCYVAKVDDQKAKLFKFFYQLTPRYRQYKLLEQSVFSNQKTKVFFLNEQEKTSYQKYYNIQENQCTVLTPNINKARFTAIIDQGNKNKLKQQLAKSLSLDPKIPWLLMVGSGFKTKGVDRSIQAVKYLHDKNIPCTLLIIGQDNPSKFISLAKKLNISNAIKFLSGRDDVASFMAVATLLLHPAYREAGGMVILESIIMGLPVVATKTCGYASHIIKANCGVVINEPYTQAECNAKVCDLIVDKPRLQLMSEQGLVYRATADIYNSDAKIIEIIEGSQCRQ